MLFNNNSSLGHRLPWRVFPIVAALLAFPLLNACGKSGSGDNGGTATTAPAQKESSTSETGGGMMDKGMGSGMMQNQKSESSQSTQTAQAAADTSATSGGKTETKTAQEEQKREPMDGYTVYSRFCVICHKSGMNGAPKYGDKKAWAPRIAQGKDTLYHAAIHGLRAMPAKGGIAGLYDQEVKDAVDYMVEGSGGWDNK